MDSDWLLKMYLSLRKHNQGHRRTSLYSKGGSRRPRLSSVQESGPKTRLTVNVDRPEGAINEKLESLGKLFVALVFARRRNALLKLLDRDLAVLQEERGRRA